MKRFLVFLSAAIVLAALVACGTPGRARLAMTPGAYTATVGGFRGELTVEVVVSERRIESVTVLDHNDWPNFAELPMQRIPAEIVAYQSLDIDMIAGATVTSFAILNAVSVAVQEAGGDVSALRAERRRGRANAPVRLQTGVLVVGSGIAGLSASIEAAYAGADVLVIDKLGLLGGTTSTSAGIFQAPNNPAMLAAGIEDSAEAFFEFIQYTTGWNLTDPVMVRHIANTALDTFNWIVSMGARFKDVTTPIFYRFPQRAIETTNRIGHEITMPMVSYAERQGVRFMKETRADSLIMQGDRVVGVNAFDRTGGRVTIYADNVILATGGFGFNPELMAQFHPLVIHFTGNGISTGSTGDGLIMGMAIGADTVKRFTPNGWIVGVTPQGVWVTPSGERFVDESYFYPQGRTARLLNLGYTHQFTILDQSHYDEALTTALAAGTAFRANTIAELARLINMEPAVLEATIRRYNEMAVAGVDLDFGKIPANLRPIVEAPFFARLFDRFGPLSSTRGGLKIDLYGRVIHTNGNIIPGLFASGEVANGQTLPIEYGGSGMALTTKSTMARLAGRTAAAGR